MQSGTPFPIHRQQSDSRYHIAITGHQQFDNEGTIAFIQQSIGNILARLRDSHPEGLLALSGLAAGADTIFAEIALRGAIPLESCLAAPDILENFVAEPERERFLTLCAMSQRVHNLPFPERSNSAYMALGRWAVDSCDLLIAVWNGLPAVAEGGTADVVAYALSLGRPVIHIHSVEHQIYELYQPEQ